MGSKSDTDLWSELPLESGLATRVDSAPDRKHHACTATCNKISSTMNVECNRQVYVRFAFNSYSEKTCIGLVDSGSDLSIISEDYLDLFLPYWRKLKNCPLKYGTLRSVTGDKIPISGVKMLHVYLNAHTKFDVKFVVVPTVGTTKCLFGRELFTTLNASLKFKQLEKPSLSTQFDQCDYTVACSSLTGCCESAEKCT